MTQIEPKWIPPETPLSVPTTTAALKTNFHYDITVVLILIVFACENTPRRGAPRDLVLTWQRSTLRQAQPPAAKEPLGSDSQTHKRHYSIKRNILSLASSPRGLLPLVNYARAWNHYTNPLPTKISLDDFIWINLNFIERKEVNRKQIYRVAELDLCFITNTVRSFSPLISKSGAVLRSFGLPVTGEGPPVRKDKVQRLAFRQTADLHLRVLGAWCDTRSRNTFFPSGS